MRRSTRTWLKLGALVLLLISGILAIRWTGLRRYTQPDEALTLAETLREASWALPAFIGTYGILSLFAFPGSVLTLAAGAIFGLGLGILASNLGATLGAAGAFQAGRLLGRDWIEEKFGGGARFERLQAHLGEHGFLRVLQLRLLPLVPFNFLNFACGVTRVRFAPYVLATMIGILPGSAVYTYAGFSAFRLWIHSGQPEETENVFVIHLVISLALLILVSVIPVIMKKRREAKEAQS